EQTVSVQRALCGHVHLQTDGCEGLCSDSSAHTTPDSAVKEVNSLFDVVTDVRARWNTNNILLMGDFNAGCSYVSGADWQQIRLFTDKSFHWLIKTMLTLRIVVTADMNKGVVSSSAKLYNYMLDLKLSHSLASGVSDHYPVEVQLS
ncbi:hypothetical protein KUCAC02_022286, partial [Chaenocephalus aceratus]